MSDESWLLVTEFGAFTTNEFADVYTLADPLCHRFFASGNRIGRTRGMVRGWAMWKHAGFEDLLVVSVDRARGTVRAVPDAASPEEKEAT